MQWPASVRYGTAFFVVMRLFWWLWGALVMAVLPGGLPLRSWMIPAAPALTGVFGWLLEPWNRWDVLWYVRIAVEGYTQADGRSTFSPLLPALIGGLSPLLGGQPLAAAALVADLACWGSLVLLFRAAQDVGGDGRRTLLILLSYPSAFFLFVPYADGPLLFCALAAWLAARSARWPLAGLFGALAVLAKVTGLLLLIPLGWEAVSAWRAGRRAGRPVWWPALWLLLPPLAAVGWAVVRTSLLGQQGLDFANLGLLAPLVSPDYEVEWQGRMIVWPWQALVAFVAAPVRLWPRLDAFIAVVDLLLAVWMVVFLVHTRRLNRPGLTWFAAAVVVANMTLIVADTPLIDAPRRWLMAFPLFLAAATLPPRWTRLWLLVTLPLQLILAVLFVKWIMVG